MPIRLSVPLAYPSIVSVQLQYPCAAARDVRLGLRGLFLRLLALIALVARASRGPRLRQIAVVCSWLGRGDDLQGRLSI